MDIPYRHTINHCHKIVGILSPFLIGYDGLEFLVHLRDGGSEITLYIWNLRMVFDAMSDIGFRVCDAFEVAAIFEIRLL